MTEPPPPLSPSEFMRKLRPEYYSDTANREVIDLLRSELEYRLSTIADRTEHTVFELFCRKLAERTLCPRLRPQTGPEGGGDSKVDTETYPAAPELAELTYYADQTNGDRWGFAFSAKKDWRTKAKSDVAKIAATARGYVCIVFITSQFAKSKDRAAIEDALTKQHGVKVMIHDRQWILDRVIDEGRKDLAFNYLSVGREVADRRLGPDDYSRTQQLDDLEELFKAPEQFEGMERQLVAEALIAAKLSRNLERPRHETDGRFARAVALAARHGTRRQQFEARYEVIWTAFWWFDEFGDLPERYDAFDADVLPSDQATDLELIANLLQLVFNVVFHRQMSVEHAALQAKADRLRDRLSQLSTDANRPSNALEAKTSILLIDLNHAMLAGNTASVSALWPQFADIFTAAKTLGEFNADRLPRLVEAFGTVAGNDPGYDALVETMAEFVAKRESEAKAAHILLKRASQIGLDDNLQMIRLLGRAARWLTKREYVDEQIEALQLLAIAYRSAGLYWAARSAALVALASIVIDSEQHELRYDIIPTLDVFAWIAIELRHVPDIIDAVQLLNGIRQGQPLPDDMPERVAEKLLKLDFGFGSNVLNASPAELATLDQAPDLLAAVGMEASRAALLYALGHEARLREEGYIPPSESPEETRDLFERLATQAVSARLWGPLVLNEAPQAEFATKILGVEITVTAPSTDAAIPVAEALLGTIEAYMATTLTQRIAPHTERFAMRVVETACADPTFDIDAMTMTGTLTWPVGRSVTDMAHQDAAGRVLYEAAGLTLAYCFIIPDMESTLDRLHHADEGLRERLGMIAAASNSRERVFGEKVARISQRPIQVRTAYPLQDERPTLPSADPSLADREFEDDHRSRRVQSVIDLHAWDAAGWKGAAFMTQPDGTPALGLLFENGNAARTIFERWRERFGSEDAADDIYIAIIQDIDAANPTHYRLLITSRLATDDGGMVVLANRVMTVPARNRVHVDDFIATVAQHGAYDLMAAILNPGLLEPVPLYEIALRKRQLSAKSAPSIGPGDIEQMAMTTHEPA
ncbi:MAG TPA: hypothetical protein DHW63_02575 [Hyphomonadaceae bacterium]|nr:hypothetical protein [Hyphomonadaceae bacterium]